MYLVTSWWYFKTSFKPIQQEMSSENRKGCCRRLYVSTMTSTVSHRAPNTKRKVVISMFRYASPPMQSPLVCYRVNGVGTGPFLTGQTVPTQIPSDTSFWFPVLLLKNMYWLYMMLCFQFQIRNLKTRLKKRVSVKRVKSPSKLVSSRLLFWCSSSDDPLISSQATYSNPKIHSRIVVCLATRHDAPTMGDIGGFSADLTGPPSSYRLGLFTRVCWCSKISIAAIKTKDLQTLKSVHVGKEPNCMFVQTCLVGSLHVLNKMISAFKTGMCFLMIDACSVQRSQSFETCGACGCRAWTCRACRTRHVSTQQTEFWSSALAD